MALSLGATLLLTGLGTGCSEARARREDARILAEFRGAHFIPVDLRRPSPAGPPLVPHVIYREDFDCQVCHAHAAFSFRGQRVPRCTHPERVACLQCHVALQTDERPFQFEMLGKGSIVAGARSVP